LFGLKVGRAVDERSDDWVVVELLEESLGLHVVSDLGELVRDGVRAILVRVRERAYNSSAGGSQLYATSKRTHPRTLESVVCPSDDVEDGALVLSSRGTVRNLPGPKPTPSSSVNHSVPVDAIRSHSKLTAMINTGFCNAFLWAGPSTRG
jgi:hypothetical protein